MISKRNLIGSIAICFMMLPAFSSRLAAEANKRLVISDGERALAAIEVQNIMSEHEY
jgi:hypothetical protein